MKDLLTRWRRDLHQIPELGLKEYKTTHYLKQELEKMGYTPHCLPQLETGLYVYIDYKQATTIAFRSDIDALPIQEENLVDYQSLHKGISHACGHDGHMSTLLGLAYYLSTHTIKIKHNLLLLFQPAEESPGAAKTIVDSHLLENYHVTQMYGIHLMPYFKEGLLLSKPGPLMAECGEIDIHIKGKSAHAGTPQEGNDALIVASQLINQIQTIHSRSISPFDDVVINLGKITGGEARNSVCETIKIEGTLRCYSEEVFNKVVTRMKEISKGLSISYNVSIEVQCDPMYPPLINDESLYNKVSSLQLLKQPMMLAEDFAFYTKVIPSLFIFVGTQGNSGLHTSTFNFNESVLEKALQFYISILKGDSI